MHAVIFEVTPYEQKAGAYFDAAAALKGDLEKIDGFISVERFQSLNAPQTYLSLSFWESEAAIKTWREHHDHRAAQAKGKEDLFLNYRIWVCHVVRDYGLVANNSGSLITPAAERNKP